MTVPVIFAGISIATLFPDVTKVCSMVTLFASTNIDPLMLRLVITVPAVRTVIVPVYEGELCALAVSSGIATAKTTNAAPATPTRPSSDRRPAAGRMFPGPGWVRPSLRIR
jgi:hypothetical protein